MDIERLRGSIPPLVTPFRGGVIDLAAPAALMAMHIDQGSHGEARLDALLARAGFW